MPQHGLVLPQRVHPNSWRLNHKQARHSPACRGYGDALMAERASVQLTRNTSNQAPPFVWSVRAQKFKENGDWTTLDQSQQKKGRASSQLPLEEAQSDRRAARPLLRAVSAPPLGNLRAVGSLRSPAATRTGVHAYPSKRPRLAFLVFNSAGRPSPPPFEASRLPGSAGALILWLGASCQVL